MNNKNQIKLTVAFILCFIYISSNPFGVFAYQIEDNTPSAQSDFVFTLLDELPIDLTTLFNLDNITAFEEMLDAIENGDGF